MTYTKLTDLNELRTKSIAELQQEVASRLRFLFKLKLLSTSGDSNVKVHLFKQVRRDIARIKTIARMISLGEIKHA